MYKVNVKTWLHVMPLRAMQNSRCTQRKSHDEVFVASITSLSFIASSLEVQNIVLFRQHCIVLWQPIEILPTLETSQRHKCCWHFSNGHWIRNPVKTTVAVSEYNGAPTTRLYTPQAYLINTDMTSTGFSALLGVPQLILCKKEDD